MSPFAAQRLAEAHEIFDGLLEVRLEGLDPYLSLWDPITTWMGIQAALLERERERGALEEVVGRWPRNERTAGDCFFNLIRMATLR